MREWRYFILCICFLAITFFEAQVGWSIERGLLGVTLGGHFDSTVDQLTRKYGKPVESVKNSEGVWHSFNLPHKNSNTIHIGTSGGITTDHVAWVLIHGEQAVEDLNFVGRVNLGQSKEEVASYLGDPTRNFARKNGDTVWGYPSSNFGVIFTNGVVSGIQIFSWRTHIDKVENKANLEVFSKLEANLKEKQSNFSVIKSDALKQYCKVRHPLFYNEELGLFLLRVYLQIEETFASYQFLVDTGWSNTAISSQLCETLGCKILGQEEEGLKRRFTLGGKLVIGGQPYNFDSFTIEDSTLFDERGIDGVIGGDALFATDLILSLKGEYLCEPSKPLSEIAQALAMNSIEAEYDENGVWINFTANGTLVNDYFIDTGATYTSFLPKDIERLGLKSIAFLMHENIQGVHLSPTFGPVIIGLPGFSLKLEEVNQSNENYRKLGNNFLSHLTLGFSPKTNRMYFTD